MIIVTPAVDLTGFHQRYVMPITTAHLKTQSVDVWNNAINQTLFAVLESIN